MAILTWAPPDLGSSRHSLICLATTVWLALLMAPSAVFVLAVDELKKQPDMCELIFGGHMDQIKLRSINFNIKKSEYGEITIFEGANRNFASLNEDSLKIKLQDLGHLGWNSSYANTDHLHERTVFARHLPPGLANPLGVYSLKQDTPTRIALNLYTSTHEYMWDVTQPEKPIKVSEDKRIRPDYSIVSAKLARDAYVFNRDIYGNTDDFAFYPLVLDHQLHLHTQVLNPTDADRAAAYYFYLERRENSSTDVVIRPRAARGSRHSSAQLFNSLPVGFSTDKNTFLFDTERACVYILRLPGKSKEMKGLMNKIQPFTVSRINKRYEEFFECKGYSTANLNDAFYSRYPVDRCEVYHSNVQASKQNTLLTYSMAGVALLAFLLVTLCFIMRRRNKYNQAAASASSRNTTTSSSTGLNYRNVLANIKRVKSGASNLSSSKASSKKTPRSSPANSSSATSSSVASVRSKRETNRKGHDFLTSINADASSLTSHNASNVSGSNSKRLALGSANPGSLAGSSTTATSKSKTGSSSTAGPASSSTGGAPRSAPKRSAA